MELQHNGIKVTLDEASAKFTATVNGRKLTAPSFDAMKRQLGKLGAFKPFPVIRAHGWRGEKKLEIANVVGLGGTRRSKYITPVPTWKVNKWGDTYSVIEDTPANRKALQAYIAADLAEDKRHDKEHERINAMLAAIPSRRADKE